MSTQTTTRLTTQVSFGSCGLGANPATPYQAGFEDRRYRREYACPWRGGTEAAREYDAGALDASAAERAEVR